MRKKLLFEIVMLTAAFLFFANGTSLWAEEVGVTDTKVKVGAFGVTTGPVSEIGVPILYGAQAVINEANKAGGIHGRQIENIIVDDRCKPEGARSAVKKLIYSDKVFCINGGICSGATWGARQEIINAKIPFHVIAATMDKIVHPANPYIFASTQLASADGISMVQFLASKPGFKRLAVIGYEDEWAKAKMSLAWDLMKERGIEMVAKEELVKGATDSTAQVLRVKQANPDGVIILMYPSEAAIVCRDAYRLGLRTPIVGTNTLIDMYDMRDRVGIPEAVENLFAASFLADSPSSFADWKKKYESYFPQYTLNANTLLGVGTTIVFIEALKRAGRNLTRESLCDAFETIRDLDTEVLSSKITFTKDDHRGNKWAKMVTLVDGKEYTMDPKWIEGLKTWEGMP